MGAGPTFICCVCTPEAAEALEEPLVEAMTVLQGERPAIKRADSNTTLAPSR